MDLGTAERMPPSRKGRVAPCGRGWDVAGFTESQERHVHSMHTVISSQVTGDRVMHEVSLFFGYKTRRGENEWGVCVTTKGW